MDKILCTECKKEIKPKSKYKLTERRVLGLNLKRGDPNITLNLAGQHSYIPFDISVYHLECYNKKHGFFKNEILFNKEDFIINIFALLTAVIILDYVFNPLLKYIFIPSYWTNVIILLILFYNLFFVILIIISIISILKARKIKKLLG